MENFIQRNRNDKSNISPIHMLAQAYYKNDRRRYSMVVIAMSLTIVLIFGVFSSVYGKFNADRQKAVCELGMTASAWLENGMEEQERQIEHLSFINKVGRYKKCGVLTDNGRMVGECVYTDEETFNSMLQPAYGKIIGRYPQNSNEVMMALSSLQHLGIENPDVGTKLTMRFDWYGMEENHTGVQELVLSGFYEDLTAYSSAMPPIYVSAERLEESNIALYPQRILIETQLGLPGNQLKELLYDQIALPQNNQVFVCMDSPQYDAVKNMLGGYGMAISFCFLFLLGMFLLIYNVLFLSLGQDTRQFGIFHIVGGTIRQLYAVIWLIGVKIALRGLLIGAGLGSILISIGMSILLKGLYSGKLESAPSLHVYHPGLLLIAGLFATGTLFAALTMVIRRLADTTPVQTQFHGNGDGKKLGKSKRKSKGYFKYHWKKNIVLYMAWKNTLRLKRKMCYTLVSMISGCLVALIGTMIITGGDRTNEIDKMYSDFTIGVTKDALVDFPYQKPLPVAKETIYDYSLISDELIHNMMLIAGTENMQYTYGCFARINDVEESSFYGLDSVERGKIKKETAFVPIRGNEYGLYDGVGAGFHELGIIQVIDENEVEALQKYMKENQLNVNIETFTDRNENGAFIIHEGALSEKEQKKTEESIGKSLYLYSVFDLHERENTYVERGQLVNCGYLDRTMKDFPDITQTWSGQNVLYFLVTEDTFHKLDAFPLQIFQLEFDVNQSKESKIRSALKQLIAEENSKFQSEKKQNVDLLFLTCKADILAEQKGYLGAGKMAIGILSASLLVMGIMNYFNVIVTDLLVRQQEFSILNCVGATRKFILKMLRIEGLLYWLAVNLFLLSVGNLIIYLVGEAMKRKIDYFVFSYPIIPYLVLSLSMLLACMMMPAVLFKKMREK